MIGGPVDVGHGSENLVLSITSRASSTPLSVDEAEQLAMDLIRQAGHVRGHLAAAAEEETRRRAMFRDAAGGEP